MTLCYRAEISSTEQSNKSYYNTISKRLSRHTARYYLSQSVVPVCLLCTHYTTDHWWGGIIQRLFHLEKSTTGRNNCNIQGKPSRCHYQPDCVTFSDADVMYSALNSCGVCTASNKKSMFAISTPTCSIQSCWTSCGFCADWRVLLSYLKN